MATYKPADQLIHSRSRPTKRGQASVEFALVLIVLLAVLYGILEISRLLLINAELENAAREGVRYASFHPAQSESQILSQAISPTLTLVEPEQVQVVKTFPNAGFGYFSPIRVQVVYTWTSMVNFMPDMETMSLQRLGPLTLVSTGTKLIEGR